MGEPKEEVKLLDEEADAKQQLASKNGKKSDSAGGTSFFTWFMVLALLGVWTSVAVVYFDLVDYQGVIAKAKDLRYNLSEVLQGKLVSYDVDGDGDFDVEDAKVLLDEKPKDALRKREHPFSRDVGLKLREALKQQLSIIHERVEAKKIARMALMEVRNLIAKEEQEKALEQKREEAEVKARDRANAWFIQQGERIEKEELEKAMERVRKEKEEAEQEEAKKAKKMEEDEAKEKSEREKKPSGKSSDSEGKKGSKSPKEGKSKKVSKSEKDH